MSTGLTREKMSRMISAAVKELENHRDDLNQLDAAIGDGDHGTSILRAMKAAQKASEKEGPFKDVLFDIGWAVEGEDCGSTSSLCGSFFQGMSEAVTSEEMNTDQVIDLFVAGLAALQKATKAQKGDKTLMDAYIPAIEKMQSLKGSGVSVQELLLAAAQAAQIGAESTKDLVARFGRARNLGERTRGHYDAGASSTALILDAYAKNVE
ncbi:MAG: dihydroxyacetone kinase subunit L [Thermoguttaceae bacterium]